MQLLQVDVERWRIDSNFDATCNCWANKSGCIKVTKKLKKDDDWGCS
jgi:hypothetical protein